MRVDRVLFSMTRWCGARAEVTSCKMVMGP
jgi:hypothetical protein